VSHVVLCSQSLALVLTDHPLAGNIHLRGYQRFGHVSGARIAQGGAQAAEPGDDVVE
jgi:hypothetical protein